MKERKNQINNNTNTQKTDKLADIVTPLTDWYRKNKRDLPWRHNPGCVPHMGIRDHAAADKSRSSKRLL